MGRVVVHDEVWKSLLARVAKLGKLRLRVGILAGRGAEQSEGGGPTVVDIGLFAELGTINAPQRSWIRSTIKSKEHEIAAIRAAIAKRVLNGSDPQTELGKLGLFVASKMRETIRERLTTGPEDQANAPSTIARKGSSTPLVDTGRLINSISHAVEPEFGEGGG